MSRDLSNDFIRESFSQDSEYALITLIEVKYSMPDSSEVTDHFTNDTQSVASRVSGLLQTYQPRAFTFKLGDVNHDSKSTAQLRIDTADNSTVSNLIQIRKKPVINVWIVLSSDLDAAEIGPINYEVETFKIQNSYIDLSLVTEPVLDEPIPGHRYTPTIFPGLWREVDI